MILDLTEGFSNMGQEVGHANAIWSSTRKLEAPWVNMSQGTVLPMGTVEFENESSGKTLWPRVM